jgi:hypothetical protein
LVIGEQRMVVDPHLDAAAKLVGIEIAGDGDHRGAVEERRADAGGEVGRARAQGRDGEAWRAREAAGDVGSEARRALVGGQDERDATPPHRLHQGQHIAAGNAEAVGDAGRFQGGDDEVGVIHGGLSGCLDMVGRSIWGHFGHCTMRNLLDRP